MDADFGSDLELGHERGKAMRVEKQLQILKICDNLRNLRTTLLSFAFF